LTTRSLLPHPERLRDACDERALVGADLADVDGFDLLPRVREGLHAGDLLRRDVVAAGHATAARLEELDLDRLSHTMYPGPRFLRRMKTKNGSHIA